MEKRKKMKRRKCTVPESVRQKNIGARKTDLHPSNKHIVTGPPHQPYIRVADQDIDAFVGRSNNAGVDQIICEVERAAGANERQSCFRGHTTITYKQTPRRTTS